jgi:hypothetical protein
MFDDRVCPACQVLLRDGTRVCVKCGQTVEPAKTHREFIDWPQWLHPRLVSYFGPVWAAVFAVALSLIILFIAWMVHVMIELLLKGGSLNP